MAGPRRPISKELQIHVFRRDGWLCRWCGRPVIFAPAMRYLEAFARHAGEKGALAYFHPNWTRDGAPLLDHLGAVIDHVHPHSQGGTDTEANFATACNKCNARKNAAAATQFSVTSPRRPVKGRYGEPRDWDGLSALFVILAQQLPSLVTASEAEWQRALAERP
jgi:5-methylcytosine-specific restriction endonuclease McrA